MTRPISVQLGLFPVFPQGGIPSVECLMTQRTARDTIAIGGREKVTLVMQSRIRVRQKQNRIQ